MPRVGPGARHTVIGQRWRTGRWITIGLIAIATFAAVSALLTAPRIGGRMDPGATSGLGGHALVALLRAAGVEVVVADSVDEVERAATPDTMLLVAETANIRGKDLLGRLAAAPGDRLILEPVPDARDTLSPGIRMAGDGTARNEPDCPLREATRAGTARIDLAATYEQAGPTPVVRCYGGAVVRYEADGRTVTVAGTSDFMTNGGLLKDGNAALAMNLAGTRPRLIWYAPQRMQGDSAAGATITELIPDAVTWVVAQLVVVVTLLALWQGRRLGPLVAERLPVVVRASETVEGRARLYRATRARGQAATALRTATLHRLAPRLGVGADAPDAAVVAAVAQSYGGDHQMIDRILFGPPPQTDADLSGLAQALDAIERQVSRP